MGDMPSSTPNRDAASQRLSSLGQRFFKFIEFDEDEELVLEIRKHPFGLFGIYLTGIIMSLVVMAVILGLNHLMGDASLRDVEPFRPIILAVGGLIAAGVLIMTAVGAYLYQSNVIFITSEKIAQVLYKNIVDRKISQLSIGDVQDVTVSQKGLFSRIFQYGTLVIETAGEQQNYTFTFVPQPYECAQAIVGSHESNLRKYGN
jgi:hypothetical protein